jgi:hypothetical protein
MVEGQSQSVSRCLAPGAEFSNRLDFLDPISEPITPGTCGFECSEASCHSSGCESRQQRSPVAVVVIPSNGEGDRSVESLEVKAPDGRAYRSDPCRGARNLAGRSKCVNREAPKEVPRAKRIAGGLGVPSRFELGEGDVGIDVLDQTMIELPGVIESGMPRRNGQRKPGTTRGSPRRSRTAKALRISRHAVKSQCACGWGGWGRLSDDDPRQHNLDQSEGPWGGGLPHLHGGARSSGRPDTARDYRTATKCAKGGHKLHTRQRMPGAGLSWWVCGKVLPYMPAFQPYWGKPAARNVREGRGNDGIIRSPGRASTLPDC